MKCDVVSQSRLIGSMGCTENRETKYSLLWSDESSSYLSHMYRSEMVPATERERSQGSRKILKRNSTSILKIEGDK